MLALAAATPVSAATVKVMTFNTHHGGTKTTPPTTDGEIDTIAQQNPDVVVLQEAYASQLSYYVNGLNSRLGTSAWHGIAAKHCQSGTQPTCTSQPGESVMIITRLQTVSSDTTLIWAKDDYWVARASAHMVVAAADGTTFNVFVCHTPAMSTWATSRLKYVSAFQAWADNFPGPRFVGGDFNEGPSGGSIVAMKTQFADAWATGGSGAGYTHPNPTATSRIDYWFTNNGPALTSINVLADLVDSDHRPVVANYTVTSSVTTTPPPPTSTGTETTLLQDSLSTLDATKWSKTLFTGSQDTSIAVAASGNLSVGPLKDGVTGSHYNGITSGAFNLGTHGYASVRLAQAPNTATLAYAFFAVGTDSNNFYRWYESGNALVIEKKLSGGKTTVLSLPYDATTMQFLKIAVEYNSATGTNDVVFSTAPNNNGVAGTYTERHREAWSSHVNTGSLKVELKAGTSDAVVSPGSSAWSTARVATIQ
ncbi:MAG TPA: endonuclease/exonuclease/phosphatase family protein [Vicinamibacterales bacterium]|nr:endonuclease/exonuclease/phosphatase family protein [Vicinamibacterales bacterium]